MDIIYMVVKKLSWGLKNDLIGFSGFGRWCFYEIDYVINISENLRFYNIIIFSKLFLSCV